jgi:hypothetical protein
MVSGSGDGGASSDHGQKASASRSSARSHSSETGMTSSSFDVRQNGAPSRSGIAGGAAAAEP